MICPECGEEKPEDVSCPACGLPVDEEADVATERRPAMGKTASPDTEEPEESEAPTGISASPVVPSHDGEEPEDESEAPTGFMESPVRPDEDDSEAPTGIVEPPLGADEEDSESETRIPSAPTTKRPAAAARERGPLEVGQQFGRYHIIRLLGLGGMGAVYHAWDEELGVSVAMKIVRPEIAKNPKAARELERRFKRELLLARQVTHANVVRIHDMGEIEGIKYITMPYVDGVELAAILKDNELGLPVKQVLALARGVVSGLLAAHQKGIVHRDLKPANIMVESDTGEALIMDFGIARVSGSGSGEGEGKPGGKLLQSPSSEGLTMAGTVVGTLEYMAPEQARGEEVDQRADLYAFGLMLYDMLAGGQRAKGAKSALHELRQRMVKPPPSLKESRPDLPAAFERIIGRLVEPDREKRYATTEDLAADFDRLDEEGRPIPITRRLSLWQVAALLVLVVAALVTVWFVFVPKGPPVEPDPVSVLIADVQNETNDATFDGSLEPMLKIALEEASFISAYDRLGIRRTLGVRPPETLDETSARELAVKQGLGFVLSGSLDPRGEGYDLSMKALEAVTGNVIVSADDRASSKDEVLAVATELANEVREALGDDLSDSARRFAMETLSATSLEVVGEYARAMEALSRGSLEDALRGFSNAAALDPDFGLAYAGMAAVSFNLGRQEVAEGYLNEAISHLDSMTERERYRTRGLFYGVTGDYKACVTEYGDLIERYAGDAASRNNLALCATFLRDWPTALEEMRRLVEMVPARDLYRENLATYLSYASEFEAGEQAAREESGVGGLTALAFAQMGQGQLAEATETYRALGEIDAQGASYMTSGLADVAMYEGRYSDAVRILREGATKDFANEEPDRAARKLAHLAQTHAFAGESAAAVAAADEAVAATEAVRTRFLAARVLIEAGELERARALAEEFASQFQAEAQAYAKILEGEAALKEGNAREAIALFTEANELLDTWLGHFDLGRAYLEAGAFLPAEGEFDRCITRRGEALSLFLDEEPTYGYFPPVYYYQGRVREGLNNDGFAESYQRYLDIRGGAGEDPLLPEVRERVGA